ncbi:TPA: ATP-dependent Clp protease ATP-binding subunit ClpL [Staphylococcus aureus]|uniref:ATP-dependent Clp protease ATP-binding subunit ClpL n=1 Tax=Staphylococcus aureus TaxID=1280 RepID=UPI0001DA244C|nr:ATP-dependent Clp protease ATP-binding subunit ClpL [Staphylococcus aureus]ADI99031.1 ATP-dependent proteinase chain [Staphylococcus aureus subsp. aureus ED133]QBY49506.1 ATP-dependent Clp protease ATP-binding subunit ClpL [Staphylococcus aureus]HEB2164783.1 ATP-dependent Clp protease ATP-binding subunit ClpL [Staphylococcus aureus]HEB2170312.1 ATP-dependent Clp protease ATP-binding subunit ClpL [Staphylococcus aureus]HEB2189533.1 ATP-dependent Clp protease ATP-binding subunit ClpL [Staphyl
MNNNFFNSDFDSILRRMMQDMQNSNQTSNKKYYINGKEVSPEELAQFTQQGGNHSAEQSAQAFQQAALRQQGQQSGNGNYLEQIGRNLTQEARDGLLDPVIGRDKEIQETAEVLSRRTKNNPILVGEAGVGKTAIVEGLAQAIVEGNVPAAIKDKEIISIDISSLEAGTQYRGAFEENIQKLVEGVKSSQNAVLFFDEIHQIIGSSATGSDSGSKGLSDILKPALSRGEISIIGATTQDEYRNNIMKDAALTRRFNEVLVSEPSAKDTVEILKGIREKFETHHQVKLPDDVLKACVDLSIQYIPQRLLPDKAIDVLDITAAHLSAQSPAIDKVATEKRISELEHDKRKAVSAEEYKKADDIQNVIKSLQDKLENSNGEHTAVATVHDISDTIQRLTGIPVSQMDANDIERLKNISSRLRSKIIGQDKAVEMVSRAIRRNRAGFDDGNRPIGSFLFVGPTGVGKTELAKQLAIDLFGNKEALIRLDMSEYSDTTAVSKMIGTTAGYVGYDDNSNTLTEKVRRNPYSVILFDEIEKANPQILTLLLQVMDDGNLTDGQGNVINFKNTIIICTSNAGFGNGTDQEYDDIMQEMKKFFRPEFLNRFNGIVEFLHLDKESLQEIINLLLDDVQVTLDKKGITMNVSQDAKDWLIEEGYDEDLGARPLRRIVEQQVRDKITDYYLDHTDVKHVDLDIEDNELVIKGKS